ncbi:MAG: sugar ABC transporter substrate-binding protein, partial [Spirochaetia bacterium]|nr:sugar ABC transporter substrate-binding protein [Spirochaetia bacterium]
MKKAMRILVVLCLISTALWGKGTQEMADQKQQITFWTMSLSPTFDDYLNDVIAQFEAKNP